MKTNYLLDTNAVINQPELIKELDGNIIIPADVLRELENLETQRRSPELSYQVRKAKRILEAYADDVTFLELTDEYLDKFIEDGHSLSYVDNRILAMALSHFGDSMLEQLVVITNDLLLASKLKAKGISTRKTNQRDVEYEGVVTFRYNKSKEDEYENEVLADIYNETTENLLGLVDGQYLEILDAEADEIVGTMKYEDGHYTRVYWTDIESHNYGKLKPRNTRQQMAFDLMQDENRPVKLLTGGQGAGKDYVMLSHALEKAELEDKKIIWVRNIVDVKDAGRIGFLPGTELEKLEPWIRLVGDIVGDPYVMEDLVNRGTLQIENLGSIRGRQFNNAIIYVTEAQNMTEEHIALLIGRAGDDTEVYLNGDWKQSDINNLSGINSLGKLAGNPLFGKVELNEIERSEVAALAELF